MTPDQALRERVKELITIDEDGGYHCIFVGGLPMYHGVKIENVQEQYEKVVGVVAKSFQFERASEARACADLCDQHHAKDHWYLTRLKAWIVERAAKWEGKT